MSSMTFFRTCPNFYKPQPLRTLEDIRADILALGVRREGCWARLSEESTNEH